MPVSMNSGADLLILRALLRGRLVVGEVGDGFDRLVEYDALEELTGNEDVEAFETNDGWDASSGLMMASSCESRDSCDDDECWGILRWWEYGNEGNAENGGGLCRFADMLSTGAMRLRLLTL